MNSLTPSEGPVLLAVAASVVDEAVGTATSDSSQRSKRTGNTDKLPVTAPADCAAPADPQDARLRVYLADCFPHAQHDSVQHWNFPLVHGVDCSRVSATRLDTAVYCPVPAGC